MGGRFQRQLDGLTIDRQTVIHDHGMWLATNHAAATFASKRRVPRIVSPRGMLSSWALQRSGTKKRLAWHAYQKRDLATATAFHATSQLEADEIRASGLAQPIAVIPNGVQIPSSVVSSSERKGRRTMLFLSRIHPKKGLLNLVRAWHAASPGEQWQLIIAGTDDDRHAAEVQQEIARLNISDQVSFPGEISDANKWQAYGSADAFVLPSFSENFGLVVAEALAIGVPVITTTGMPWQDVCARRAGWRVEPSVAGLTTAIREATNLSPRELQQMGSRRIVGPQRI